MVTKPTVRVQPDRRYPVVDPASLPDTLEPLPDGMYQNPHFLDAVLILGAHFSSRPDVFVDGNTIVCYNPDNLNDRVLPDCYVAFGVWTPRPSTDRTATACARRPAGLQQLGNRPETHL